MVGVKFGRIKWSRDQSSSLNEEQVQYAETSNNNLSRVVMISSGLLIIVVVTLALYVHLMSPQQENIARGLYLPEKTKNSDVEAHIYVRSG